MRVCACLAVLWTAIPSTFAAQQQPSIVDSTASGYTVDCTNQNLRTVLTDLSVAAGINVAFGNLPEARVTLHLRQPMPKEKLFDVLRSVAQQNGLTVTEESPLVRIESNRRRSSNGGASKTQFYTYRLKHANAAQLVPVLTPLFVGRSLVEDGGEDGGQSDVEAEIKALVDSGSGGGRLRRARALSASICGQDQQCVDRLMQPSGAGGVALAPQSQVRIVAEEATNSLLIRGTEKEWELVQKILGDIDLRPQQVLIEAMIVEVVRTKALNVGIDATVTRTTPGQTVKTAQADLPATPDARDFLLQLTGGKGTVNFTAALNALATRGDLRVRSLPILVGQNNKEALLNVGSSRPFVQVTQTVPNDPTGRVQTIQYIDVGTTLKITPRVNGDGYVNLQVAQTANNATTEIQFDAPVLSRREATTQVFLRDGQTTVIGGLADHTNENTRTGIPILRSLPLLGGLFGSTHHNDTRTELYVFLTPHILSNDADIDYIRNTLQQRSPGLKEQPVEPLVVPPRPETPAPPQQR